MPKRSRQDPLPHADVLIVAVADDFLQDPAGEPFDPLADELKKALGIAASAEGQAYARGAGQYLAELRAHDRFLEDRDRFWRLRPRLRYAQGAPVTGRYFDIALGGRSAVLFMSDLRLTTDGPTTPVVRLIQQVAADVSPELVIYVGLGGGVEAGDNAGDVAVATQARFALRGELEGTSWNGTVVGSRWVVAPSVVQDIGFKKLQEPPLLPPSPSYGSGAPQPAPHQPGLRIETKPVLTRPLVTDMIFDLASPDPQARSHWGKVSCAIDMDAAGIVAGCGDRRCALVIGLMAPAINEFKDDYESTLRRAWLKDMVDTFAVDAAQNAAGVARVVAQRA